MGRGIGLLAALVFAFQFVGYTQNYYEFPIKEEFDLFNRIYDGNKNYCSINISWNSPDSVAKYSARYGDGLSKTLQGYLEMHALTGDDAYLYKFMLEAMCMMEHRADYLLISSIIGMKNDHNAQFN